MINKPTSIDTYIAGFPPDIQEILQRVREVVKTAVPAATEAITYGMPTFKLAGNLVHFAAAKHHLGFYPAPSGIEAFRAELTGYTTSKGAIQFPYDQPIPYDLIGRIAQYRATENLEQAAHKRPLSR